MVEIRSGVGTAAGTSNATATGAAKHGDAVWNYFYIILGFVISIGTTVILMMPLGYPRNIVWFIIFTVGSVWLILFNGWFRKRMLLLKSWYENRWWDGGSPSIAEQPLEPARSRDDLFVVLMVLAIALVVIAAGNGLL
jgi:hypothetical protein